MATMSNRQAEIHQEYVERGRILTEAGELDPSSQLDRLALVAYHRDQRERVASTGTCNGKCQCAMVKTKGGHTVCPHTWEPCIKLEGQPGK